MTIGVYFIVYLGAWYLVAIMLMWYCCREQVVEHPSSTKVCFALQEGQTILGVMDKTAMMCFCLGEIEEHVHDEEDTIK